MTMEEYIKLSEEEQKSLKKNIRLNEDISDSIVRITYHLTPGQKYLHHRKAVCRRFYELVRNGIVKNGFLEYQLKIDENHRFMVHYDFT